MDSIKQKNSKPYVQKFSSGWLEVPAFKEWVLPVESDKTKAYCKCCKCHLQAHFKGLENTINPKNMKKQQNLFQVEDKQNLILNLLKNLLFKKRKRKLL